MDYLFSEVPLVSVKLLFIFQERSPVSCALGVLQEAQQRVWTRFSNHCGAANAAKGEFSLFTNSMRMKPEEFPMKSSRISCVRCSRPNRNRIPSIFLWNPKIMQSFSFICNCWQMSLFIFLSGFSSPLKSWCILNPTPSVQQCWQSISCDFPCCYSFLRVTIRNFVGGCCVMQSAQTGWTCTDLFLMMMMMMEYSFSTDGSCFWGNKQLVLPQSLGCRSEGCAHPGTAHLYLWSLGFADQDRGKSRPYFPSKKPVRQISSTRMEVHNRTLLKVGGKKKKRGKETLFFCQAMGLIQVLWYWLG